MALGSLGIRSSIPSRVLGAQDAQLIQVIAEFLRYSLADLSQSARISTSRFRRGNVTMPSTGRMNGNMFLIAKDTICGTFNPYDQRLLGASHFKGSSSQHEVSLRQPSRSSAKLT